jgi:hypothetical protein
MRKPKNKMLPTEINFEYQCKYDYHIYHACEDGSDCCKDDFCRCGVIEDAVVTKAPTSLQFIKELSDYMCEDTENVLYFLDRIYYLRQLYNNDSYDVTIEGGYYGEEIEGVYIKYTQINEDIEFLEKNKNNLKKLQEYLLNIEYGYVHDRLKNKKYSIQTLNIENICLPAMDHIKVNKQYDIDTSNILGLVVREDRFNLLDGYHRVIYCKNNNITSGKFIVAE